MQQDGSKYFASRHTLDPGGGVKRSKPFFMKEVLLHIKFKGIELHASTYFVLVPWVGSTSQNIFCSESSHVAYQIKGNGA